MAPADTPVTGFRPFFNPATGEWITYTVIAADSGGQLVRFNWRSVPGGVITEHIHPHQEERFTILVGEAHFTLNGREHVAGARDRARRVKGSVGPRLPKRVDQTRRRVKEASDVRAPAPCPVF